MDAWGEVVVVLVSEAATASPELAVVVAKALEEEGVGERGGD